MNLPLRTLVKARFNRRLLPLTGAMAVALVTLTVAAAGMFRPGIGAEPVLLEGRYAPEAVVWTARPEPATRL